jgi:hypothetical protein
LFVFEKPPAKPGAFFFFTLGEDFVPFGIWVLRKGQGLRISGV